MVEGLGRRSERTIVEVLDMLGLRCSFTEGTQILVATDPDTLGILYRRPASRITELGRTDNSWLLPSAA